MKKLTLYLVLATLFTLASCNDLSQDVHSEITEDNFFQTEEQVLSAAGPAYSGLRTYTQVAGIWGVREMTTDEMVLPTRGRHWYNDGMYQRYQRHTWHSEEGNSNIAWNDIFSGINTTNRLLAQFEEVDQQSDALDLIKSELRALRAFWYFTALDLFGNVPIVTSFEDAEAAPSNNTKEEVFNFIEQELTSVMPQLSSELNSSTYGRFHSWAAHATLVKLYMNAETYVGEPHWQEALNHVNAIIDSGNFSLSGDFFSNFAVENQGSSENIFVIPYDNTYTTSWGSMHQFPFWTIHFAGHPAVGMQNAGWDGFAGMPDFVRSFSDEDIRKDQWLIGLQTSPEGDTLRATEELSGQPLVYEIDIRSLENANENDGARWEKYDYSGMQGWTLSNDYVVFRYADILLHKAEILMRQNGGQATQEAVNLVNQVRSRAFENPSQHEYTTSSLTMDELLAERGREMSGEGWRRHDLIRFGEYTDGTWQWKDQSQDYRKFFPIPQQQLNANPNLEQNPGY